MANINSGFKVTCDIIVTGNREYDAAAVAIILFKMRDVTTVTTVTIRVNIEYVET